VLYGYSLRDNLTSATDQLDPAEDVGYGYDPRQMLESATGPWGTLAWAYDPVGNRASETLTPPGGGAAMTSREQCHNLIGRAGPAASPVRVPPPPRRRGAGRWRRRRRR